MGLRLDGNGDARHFHSQLRSGTAASSLIFTDAVLVSAVTLGGIPQPQHGAAGSDALRSLHGLHRASLAFGNAGSSEIGLRSHSPSERPERASGGRTARLVG